MTTPVDIAVVGHTNTGKTSLMRTLTRRRDFGDVSARPATTRHVEMARIDLDGDPLLALYDTPGLEDSSGLLAHLDAMRAEEGVDWPTAIDLFAAAPARQKGFDQEAKAIARLRASDVALYVVDARDPVRAKHRDEMEILGRCAVPVVPVLNFTATDEARTAEWRTALARANMHAVAAFDTVVFDAESEIALYGKIATLLDRRSTRFDRLIADLRDRRRRVRHASAALIADMLVDVAAARRGFAAGDDAAEAEAAQVLKDAVRAREKATVGGLIALNEFDPSDYAITALTVRHGAWRDDPFDPATLAEFGLAAGRAAAAGAAAGLAVDLMVGGITLGAAAATGAAFGFLVDTIGRYGGRILDGISGRAVLRVEDGTIRLLALRQMALARALLHRGHGAVTPIEPGETPDAPNTGALPGMLRPAARHPDWSSLNRTGAGRGGADISDGDRQALAEDVRAWIEPRLAASPQGD